MPVEAKMNYIELPAANIPAVQAFYEAAFGWKFTSYGDDYVAFNDGDMDGGFYRAELKSTTAAGATLLVLYASNLEESQRAVEVAGGTIVKEIFSFPGGRRFHFADPNQNELAIWSDK